MRVNSLLPTNRGGILKVINVNTLEILSQTGTGEVIRFARIVGDR